MGKEDMRSPDPKEFLLASDVERASEKHVLLNCPLFQQSSRQGFEAWKRLRAVFVRSAGNFWIAFQSTWRPPITDLGCLEQSVSLQCLATGPPLHGG